jgi:hypothetical protein
MTDRGEIPVEYRGSHRRIRQADVLAWLEHQKLEDRKRQQDRAAGGHAGEAE